MGICKKCEYKNGETIITAENLNNIQDAILALEEQVECGGGGGVLLLIRELLANAVYFKDVSALLAELDNAIGHASATITYAGGVLTIKANANITATQSGAALLIA